MKPNKQDKKSLALWAADSAEQVVPYFEKERPKDKRPWKAIAAGRAWARGEITVSQARTAALASHAAARVAKAPAAIAAARAAGHAAATAHVAGHAQHTANYALKARRLMPKLDFISYLRTLEPDDWDKQVTNRWTVKDVVAHMIGWEKIDPHVIRETWRTKKRPWFYETDDFDDFNKKSVAEYRGYSPGQLMAEWEKSKKSVQAEIDRIGEKKLRAMPSLFGWLFEREGTERGHYNHHFQQIKKAVARHKNISNPKKI